MVRHLWTTFFLCFSFVILLFGGYNCAQETRYPDSYGLPGGGPTDFLVDLPPAPPSAEPPSETSQTSTTNQVANLPPEPTGRCHRDAYRRLQEKHGGGGAFIHLNKANLVEYRKGAPLNFAPGCPRMILSLTKKGRRFKGELRIYYEDVKGGQVGLRERTFSTGSSEKDIQYNQWFGKREEPDRNGVLDSRFIALFENKGFGAIMLHINRVVRYDVADGEVRYTGYGDLWMKAFRAYEKGDTCGNEGAYNSQARRVAPHTRIRCWNANKGVFTCLPEGKGSIGTASKQFDADRRSLDPRCYLKLGEFGNLDIQDSFNLFDEEETHDLVRDGERLSRIRRRR